MRSMNTITSLTPQQLRQAAGIKEKIAELEKQLASLLGSTGSAESKPTRTRSAAAKAATSAKMKAAWARRKALALGKPGKAAKSAKQPKRKMSAAAKAKISQAAKARWAKVKAAGQSKL